MAMPWTNSGARCALCRPPPSKVLRGGERIQVGGRSLEVAYTPGHASHHVCYFSSDTGIAFVGDTAGVRLPPHDYALPPTPPPDVDLERWRESLARLAVWAPDTLFLTHFGPVSPSTAHLAEFGEQLERVAVLARRSLTEIEDGGVESGKDADREAWFTQQLMRELRQRVSEEEARAYEVAGRFDLNWRGLARYWRKRSARR